MDPPISRVTVDHLWRREKPATMGGRMSAFPPATPSWVGLKLTSFKNLLKILSVLGFDLFTSFTQEHLGKLRGDLLRTYTEASAHRQCLIMELPCTRILTLLRTSSLTRKRSVWPRTQRQSRATVFMNSLLTAAGLIPSNSTERALSWVTLCYSWRGWPKKWAFLPHWHFAIKDSSNVQGVNVKDNLMFLEKSKKEHTSSCSSHCFSLIKIDDYIHFYIKFIIFCKLYINRFHYFCLPVVYEYFAALPTQLFPLWTKQCFAHT